MRSFADDFPFGGDRSVFAPPFSDYIEDVVLAADTVVRVAIPAGARYAFMSFEGDVRAKVGVLATTFTLPTASTTDGSGSEVNPTARRIPGFLADGTTVPTHIVLRSPTPVKGSIAFYG